MNCDCITKIDNTLLENGCGYRLATTLTFDDKMNISVNLSVPTVWNDEGPRKRRKPPPPVLCSFCPFCGEPTAPIQTEAQVTAKD